MMYSPRISGSLADAFALQDEIRILKESIASIQREVDRRQENVSAIIQEQITAGIWNEGSLSILEKPGRRTFNLKAFEKGFSEQFNRVVKVEYLATIVDIK